MSSITYPFDPTGNNPLSRVTNEQHVLTSLNNTDLYQTVIPSAAPFFTENIIITFNNPDTSVRILVEGVDYYFTHLFISASKATAKPVAGSITFLDRDITGVLRLTYQTIGGAWVLSDNEIAEILANMNRNPRITAWEQITDLPFQFPVIDHEWDLVDLVGASDIVDSLNDIRDTILAGTSGGIAAHIADTNNPHEVSKTQVGLGSVENYPIATQSQAQVGTNNTSYMTPLRVAQAINELGGGSLATHVDRVDNPHNVTKAQVGLENVENYGIANSGQALAGTSDVLYMTPLKVKTVVDVVSTALSAHVSNNLNPHNVTKDQIGLNNVQNYSIATAVEAQNGTVNDKYMTPLRVAQAISALSSVELNAHLSDLNNPHSVTKTQVGLGSVENFPIASQVESEEGTTSVKYMTPLRTSQAITALVGQSFVNHLNDTNPHGVTKAQVGLSDVENYSIALQAEAEAGVVNNKYMTPLRVKQAIVVLASGDLSAHTLDFNNPHAVTKTQVGLGNVENYPIATQVQAEEGNDNDKYMTPFRTYQAISILSLNPLNTHISDSNNPHTVTKTQIGLSNVQNYPISSQAEAEAGNDNDKYMTPLRTAQAISVLATGSIGPHLADLDNPHQVTKTQVGLGNVQNYDISSEADAQAGLSNSFYMTPQRTAQAISSQVGATLSTHVGDTNNPHNVTATQLGVYTTSQVDTFLSTKLGSTETAVNSALLEGKSATTITDEATIAALEEANVLYAQQSKLQKMDFDSGLGSTHTWVQLGVLTLDDSVANDNSPLSWIISNIGLNANDDLIGPNYSLDTYLLVASIAENLAGDEIHVNSQISKLTTGGNITVEFAQQIDETNKEVFFYIRVPNGYSQFSITNLNPHEYQLISPLDVGITTPVDSTPIIPVSGGGDIADDLNDHITNVSNPHSVTKTQVGLGNVEDYVISSQVEAEAGTDNDKYMTPLRTSQAIAALGSGAIMAHTSNTSNPHSVTKVQVGLGSVENYAIASQAEAEAGTSTTTYMTPERTKQAITLQVEAMLTTLVAEVTAGFEAIATAMAGS